MVWSRNDFSVKNACRFAESISGDKNGMASFLMSSLLSHRESLFPPAVTICSGVTGKVSNSRNWAFKKLVTGKIFTVSVADGCVEAGLFSVSQALK